MNFFWQISHSWIFLSEIVLSSSVSIVFFLTLFTLSYTLAFSLCVILFIIFLSIFLSSTLSLFFSLSLPHSLTVLVSPSLSLSLSLTLFLLPSLSLLFMVLLSVLLSLLISLSLPPSLSLVWICPCFCSQSLHSSIVEQLSLCRVKIRQQRKFELTPRFNGPRVTVGWDRPVPAMLRKLCPDSNLMLNFPVKRQDEVNARTRSKIFGIGEAVDLLFLPLDRKSSPL